jgi:uncharacterized protein (UPF0548 family)
VRASWHPTSASLAGRLVAAEGAELTYPVVGASAAARLPADYARLLESTHVGDGPEAFERLGDALLRWDLHRTARMILATSAPTVEVGCTVVNAAPFGPVALLAPCRVVDRYESDRCRAFSYGTLPGHPLTGEERFSVELDDAGRVHLRIRSFSRPVGLARISPAVARAGQRFVNRRYAAAARRLAG